MKLKEKTTEEIVVLRYYNVLFYMFFKVGVDDFKRQCLVNWIKSGENLRMKQIQEWCHWHQIPVKTKFFYRKDFPVKPTCGTYIHTADLKLI